MQYASRFNCSHCRKRRTSPSVRVLGRRVYLALVILLMAGRLTARTPGAQEVCASLDVPGRTLRRWWMQDFPTTSTDKIRKVRVITVSCRLKNAVDKIVPNPKSSTHHEHLPES